MGNITVQHLDLTSDRVTLHDILGLSGCEVSINTLPAGASVPFIHSHKQNEEVYIVLQGSGTLYIDGEEIRIGKGDCFRIDPAGERCIRAGSDALTFICIQTKAHSLEGFTMTDGVVVEGKKPSWC